MLVKRGKLPSNFQTVYLFCANALQVFSSFTVEAYYILPSIFILSAQKSETFNKRSRGQQRLKDMYTMPDVQCKAGRKN
jgi:hypothetical protein